MLKIDDSLVGKYVASKYSWVGHIQGYHVENIDESVDFYRSKNPIVLEILTVKIDDSVTAITYQSDVRMTGNPVALDDWMEIGKDEFDAHYYRALGIMRENHAE